MHHWRKVKLELCNQHLTQLFGAIEAGNIQLLQKVEHELTHEEECVACAYALRARGEVRKTLDEFLQHEGFEVDVPDHFSLKSEIIFWVVRGGVFIGLLLFFYHFGSLFKTYIVDSKTMVALGSFGMVGAFLMSIVSFVALEQWVLD